MISDPRGAFTCRSSTLAVFVDFGAFLDYYSPFWVLGVIFMIDEPRSPTLAGLADSGPFRGLLLTVWGSRSDFLGL